MSTQRFFLSPESIDLASGQVEVAERSLISQMRSVLRLKTGDQFVVLNGLGQLFTCILEEIAPTRIRARIVDASQASGDLPIVVTIALPLLKGDRFDWALQKLTELGVAYVLPFVSDRSVVKLDAQTPNPNRPSSKLSRWQTIMKEAAEQSERASIPQIQQPAQFRTVLASIAASAKGTDLSLICAERRRTERLSAVLTKEPAGNLVGRNVALAVGPEGGFSPQEIELAIECGFQAVSLGPRILRSETAAIYAVSHVVAILADG
jgi:16S rRNA (uracil1498-N3)-methyltransferase